MKPLALNIAIAVIWLLLSTAPSVGAFLTGFAIGFLLIAAFSRALGDEAYARRGVALVRFLMHFFFEYLAANLKVATIVLFRRRESLLPGFVTYDTSGLTRAEILLLYYGVSLTPGTTAVEIADDFSTLTFHALDAKDPAGLRSRIDRTLKRPILSFTR